MKKGNRKIEKTSGKRNKTKNKSKEQIYLLVMIISIIVHICSIIKFKISIIVAIYPIILLFMSVLCRKAKNKRLSNIICTISAIFICIIALTGLITTK